MIKLTQRLSHVLLAASMLAGGAAMADEKFANGFQAAEEHEYKKAIAQWEPLAKQGSPEAMFMLGTLYHSGLAGEADEKTAVSLYHKAAESGHLVAQEYLAIGYQEGWFGLKQDRKKARYWHKQVKNNPGRMMR